MFGIILTPFYKTVLILATIVSIFATGYYKGYRNTQDKFDTYKLQQQVVVQSTIKVQDQISKEIGNVHKVKANALSSYYNGMHNNGSNTVSNSTEGVNGNPTYSILIRQCASTTLQLVDLQEWVRKQSEQY